jgi:hypothetical protein
VATATVYASKNVNPDKKRRLAGYDLRFQKVRPMNPSAPRNESIIIQKLVWIQVLKEMLKKETAERAAVARSWTVLDIHLAYVRRWGGGMLQDCVDLSYECMADVDAPLCDGAAEFKVVGNL